MANKIQQSSDLWDLEYYLTKRRKEIDRKYDYRYSQLTQVFGRLLHEKRLREDELRGLREDKLNAIRSFAKFSTVGVTSPFHSLTWTGVLSVIDSMTMSAP
jgi:hypothetical protein